MRFEMTFHTYVEVFNRLVSLRFDPKDWLFKVSKTPATRIIYLGPIHIGYTNQTILNERIKEMIQDFEQDFSNYQATDKSDYSGVIEISSSNIVH